MQAASVLEPAKFGLAAQQTITVHVRMPDGRWLSPRLACGNRLYPALREFGIPLNSASCKVRVEQNLRGPNLPADAAAATALGVRVLSDLLVAPDLDGLELELGDDSLEPQTYWVAG